MYARSKKHYRRVWNAHVEDTSSLLFAAGVTLGQFEATMAFLRECIERAVEKQNLPETDERTERIIANDEPTTGDEQ